MDAEKNGLMTTIHKLDRRKGLNLLLHTPGRATAATESIVDYLRPMFGQNIRAIIPQLALSGGTMIALACREIVMGRQSSLGPIDPQIAGIPAHGVIEEFNQAQAEMVTSGGVHAWQPTIAKYTPALIGECQKAIKWTNKLTKEWLLSGMFDGDPTGAAKAERIVKKLGDHALTLSHERHIGLEQARTLGLKVVEMEQDDRVQDAILSVHHVTIQTLTQTRAAKIIENHKGVAFIAVHGG